MGVIVVNASDWDREFYEMRIKPQYKELRKAKQSYENLLRTAEDRPKSTPNPFFVLDRMKKLPAEIQQMRAKRWLTEQERRELQHKEFNYAKFLNMMQTSEGKISHGEIGSYHPDASRFIRSYINNPEQLDRSVTFSAGYPITDEVMKNLSIKDLGDYQGAIREKIQEHKWRSMPWGRVFSGVFSGFTAPFYNYWYSRKK